MNPRQFEELVCEYFRNLGYILILSQIPFFKQTENPNGLIFNKKVIP